MGAAGATSPLHVDGVSRNEAERVTRSATGFASP